MAKVRDSWGSRLGIIMAVAGSAIGLGNFLRFPAKTGGVKKTIFLLVFVPFVLVNMYGCWFLVGGAVGAAGAYVVSKDTVRGETDKSYDSLWNSALTVSRIRGTIKQEDSMRGYIELEADSSRVCIRLIRLTRATTRLIVSSRKHRLPNLGLAQDIFVKIMEEAK